MVDPITPPISACDELEGIPKNQVSRFQIIPPASPAATTLSVTSLVSTRPLAIVAATLSDRNAPTKFSTPDRATATRGFNALVAMDVAIALPVSWKPLVKSKHNAVITTSTSRKSFLTRPASPPRLPMSRVPLDNQATCQWRVVIFSPVIKDRTAADGPPTVPPDKPGAGRLCSASTREHRTRPVTPAACGGRLMSADARPAQASSPSPQCAARPAAAAGCRAAQAAWGGHRPAGSWPAVRPDRSTPSRPDRDEPRGR